MAIYHCSVKPICRSAGQSSCASSAYRSAEKIKDERTEIIHDYTRKKAVDFTALIGWDGDRSSLWNAAEKAEKRKDATVAREYEIAIPRELSLDEKKALVLDYANWLYERHNVAVDVCVHKIDSDNPHAHIMTTTRSSTGDQLGEKVSREWSDTKRKKHGLNGRKNDLIEARNIWSEKINQALEKNNINEKITHLSFLDQGISKTPQIHVGYAAKEIEKRGEISIRGELNRKIIESNSPVKKIIKNESKETLFHHLHLDTLGKENVKTNGNGREIIKKPNIDLWENPSIGKSGRWQENILRNLNGSAYGRTLRKLSDIPRSLPRMPKRDLYDREQQRKQDSSTVLLQPISPRDMGLNEQKTDRILRRGESSEQKLTLSYTYDADSRSYQIRLNGKKPSDVVTDDQLKLIRKHDSFLSKISIDNIRNGSVNLLELKDNIPQPKEIDPTIFKGIEEISENKQSKGFHM